MLRLPDLNLGELEMAALECMWRIGDGDVKRVHAELRANRAVGLNTVQSTLDRLYRKNILERRKQSHAFVYRPRVDRTELVSRAISAVLDITGGEVLTAFVDIAARTSPAVLTELETALAERISAARNKT